MYLPISTKEQILATMLAPHEIANLPLRGLFLDMRHLMFWTKLSSGQMMHLGGGKATDISKYPGMGQTVTTELPVSEAVKRGELSSVVDVLNHLYARSAGTGGGGR